MANRQREVSKSCELTAAGPTAGETILKFPINIRESRFALADSKGRTT
jgi:hypothetical protein